VRAITSTPDVSELSPKFSPDGKRIAYAGQDAAGVWDIRMMNADGSNDREIAGGYKFSEFPAWTRDGRQVYYAAIPQDKDATDIYSVDVETLEVVTRIATPGADLCPHFSPDGEYMTYATSPVGEENNVDLFRHEISSDDTTGASDERLTTSGGSDDYGNPSPDGKRYVFVSKRDGNFELYLMDTDGSNQRRLTNTPDVRENVPDW
jgi:TolB protein